jgi:hypothetical protein
LGHLSQLKPLSKTHRLLRKSISRRELLNDSFGRAAEWCRSQGNGSRHTLTRLRQQLIDDVTRVKRVSPAALAWPIVLVGSSACHVAGLAQCGANFIREHSRTCPSKATLLGKAFPRKPIGRARADRLKRLSDLGDQLEAFGSAVDFEIFRGDLVSALAYSKSGQGGRPPFDPVMMFKILVIQAANNLSDERTEFLINDRLSFMRFLGLGLSDRVPDARTIWLFREKLTKAEAIKTLFARFDAALRVAGYIATVRCRVRPGASGLPHLPNDPVSCGRTA